jgi:hypothetical protein
MFRGATDSGSIDPESLPLPTIDERPHTTTAEATFGAG